MARFAMVAMLVRAMGAMSRTPSEEMPLLQISSQSLALTRDPALYVKGGTGANSCPHGTHPLHSPAVCNAAADFLGLSYDGEESDPGWPAGCYLMTTWMGSHVYFNGHHSGSAHGSGEPLCARAAAYHESYTQGETNSNYCPSGSHPIRSADACKEAATAQSLVYMDEENEAEWPIGCYIFAAHAVYFNGHHSGAPHADGAPMCARATNDDSCIWSEDGHCDVPDHCNPGTDCTDCGNCGEVTVIDEDANDDSCIWSGDGVCDVPDHCDAGTDCTDCGDCTLLCDALLDCNGHGTTTDDDKTDGCICHCTDGFSGDACATPPPPCVAADDCSGHGTTEDPDASDGCICTCSEDFRGDDCSIPPACSSAHHCNGHSTLDSDSTDGCECHCDHGWSGEDCMIPPPCAHDADCNGHGYTLDDDRTDGCECDCIGGFSGDDCLTPPPCDASAECSGHGAMHDLDATDGCRCTCQAAWKGDDCSSPVACTTMEKWTGVWTWQ